MMDDTAYVPVRDAYGRRGQTDRTTTSLCRALLVPALTVVVALGILAHGTICFVAHDLTCGPYVYANVAEIFVGVFGPMLLLHLCMRCHRRGRREEELGDLYGDALLEEMLSGDTLFEHYTIRGTSHIERGTIVFVGGLACPRVINNIHTRYLSKMFRTISVDMPGHGTLNGVQYSLSRSVRVLKRVIDNEVSAAEQQLSVVLVGYGAGIHVVASAAKQHPDMCSGVVVAGNLRNYSCVGCCRFGSCSAQLLRESWVAEIFNWMYEDVLDDCNQLSTSRIPQRFHWELAPDWIREVHGRSIVRMLSRLKQNVLVISNDRNALEMCERDNAGLRTALVAGVDGDILPSCVPGTLNAIRSAIESFANESISSHSALDFVERGSPMYRGNAESSFSGDDDIEQRRRSPMGDCDREGKVEESRL